MSEINYIHSKEKYYSWTIESRSVAIKQCDKSVFEHHGSGIPRDICWFFGANTLEVGAKRAIKLVYEGKEYDAYIRREKNEIGQIQMFWYKNLGVALREYNVPGNYPRLRFERIGDDVYYISLQDEVKQNNSAIEVENLIDNAKLPEEMDELESEFIIEGAKRTITINSYERDPSAKKRCKEFYLKRDGRVICQICGFDFGKIYGPKYANMIHVHHIIPISKIGEDYIVDPIKDLIPVCPNCHMVLHAGVEVTVEMLRKIFEK